MKGKEGDGFLGRQKASGCDVRPKHGFHALSTVAERALPPARDRRVLVS